MTIESINPATGKPIARYELTPASALPGIVERAHAAFLQWRQSGFAERTAPLQRAAGILRRNEREYAQLMAQEMGKPVSNGLEEVRACAAVCEHYAEHAAEMLADTPLTSDFTRSRVVYRPLGVVLGVQPWNWPFHQVFRMAVPALAAGNAVVVKHASNVPGCARAIEDVFVRAQLPPDLLRVLLLASADVEALVSHPLVRGVSLTGSGPAGAAVARAAGGKLKKSVLELGGSDPYLVLADADIELAARICTQGRLGNSGQSCIAAKRMIVVKDVRAAFEERFVALMGAARVGDPLLDDTVVGPLARRDLRDALHAQVQASVAAGARLLLGGAVPEGPGSFYPATVLTDVRRGMPAFDEELFGPVAAIVPVADEGAAIAAANDSAYGLGGCVLTRDVQRGERIAADLLDSGMAWVNGCVREDPRLPFGGIKDSGYGREQATWGIREFVNVKTVVVT
ncbi:NAD-dependent succinate-semialdehyde dehydrogenase [Variovorax ginsengisoli]|uniref:NAD-dependent succinate-semialdehyde dehydrogenase n=1 Tax=Variovorax ginsengisoli TaxID=363844 RepID=A0ABT8SE99_9BURK|nr:NAD-dependent succinate-semialdehyde dehydrogenase [Variovorax ginsengisoli]MDN8618082.1 NAD-dependent succinate-semialdehyde dehydrogenase [Variovorax ginsengisoli]MDO1537252.1 NAD-dependent succinate-semialdehyde dehydrogenase [Variovorax ginsengisoli]